MDGLDAMQVALMLCELTANPQQTGPLDASDVELKLAVAIVAHFRRHGAAPELCRHFCWDASLALERTDPQHQAMQIYKLGGQVFETLHPQLLVRHRYPDCLPMRKSQSGSYECIHRCDPGTATPVSQTKALEMGEAPVFQPQ
ncbi:MAG: hypothetical protein ACOH2H_06560 [Cypionkella sp.]